jgi:hypothetical protein
MYTITLDGKKVTSIDDKDAAEAYAETLWMKYGLTTQVIRESDGQIICEYEA